MTRPLLSLLLFILFHSSITSQDLTKHSGYFNYHWEESTGKIWLEVGKLNQEFLYVNSLPAGVGSNDIGLDRGQLGGERIVRFERVGPKLLMIESNYSYRAVSNNAAEVKAVKEAFAESTLWGFKIEKKNEIDMVDLTSFLLRDAHGVSNRLESSKQGSYKLDASRSAVYLPRTKNFPDNSEFEATVTFTGKPKGQYIRSVTPSADAVTVRMHHSFIKLPDNQYKPRKHDARSGFNGVSFFDYATPIDQEIQKRFTVRHRLNKKNPKKEKSEAVEPIVYYIDPGCPEPIKSALMEGASWWNQAFEAAGYINAFQVKELPATADPMDVRYNMIQWVHRSTRGWSYGASVRDPRTGEIIKGHVSLGSLRVRQDYLIAQGLKAIFENGDESADPLVQLALARLRQLAAHEVGHTIGLMHNFASSVNDRASVMDYPHPYIELDQNGNIDFSNAYATGIGDWDKRTIIYGYSDFPSDVDENAELEKIIKENIASGFLYISDQDARPTGGMHPHAHLWDNGKSASEELKRLSNLRKVAMKNFGEKNIPSGTSYAYLEQVFVPLYLAHRYQVEAAAKVIGGVNYSYAMRGDGQPIAEMIPASDQKNALNALISTLNPSFLAIPEEVISKIPPQPAGYRRHRELFETYTGLGFDPLAAAESSVANTFGFLLHPQRLARLVEQHGRSSDQLSVVELLDEVQSQMGAFQPQTGLEREISRIVEKQYWQHVMQLAGDKNIHRQVSASALKVLNDLGSTLASKTPRGDSERAHLAYLQYTLDGFFSHPEDYKWPSEKEMPPGSPIGCGVMH